MSRSQRCRATRDRVNEWIDTRGGSNSSVARVDMQRLFVHKAVTLGKEKGLRLWKPGPGQTVEDAALQSLRYLLMEKTCVYKGRSNTGGNQGWVLDLWDAVLGAPTETPEEPRFTRSSPHVHVIREADAEVKIETEVSISLGRRIIEAFILRDEQRIVELAREVDQAA